MTRAPRKRRADREASPPLRSALRHRDFRLLWCGQTVSSIGDQIFPIAIVALILDRGGTATDLSMVLAARALAAAAFVVVAGVVADRYRRTRVMIGADFVRFVAVVGLALVAYHPPIGLLVLLSFLIGLGEAFFQPAYSALFPIVLPRDELRSGNALTSLSVKAATVVGPALAGVFVASAGIRVAFFVDAATFAVSIASLVPVAERPREKPEAPVHPLRAVVQESREGLTGVMQRRWLRRTIVVGAVHLMTAVGPLMVLLPVVTNRSFGDAAFGVTLATFGAGAVVGAVAGGKVITRQPGLVAALGMGSVVLPLGALAGPLPLVVVCAAFFVAGLGMEVFNVLWQTALQQDVPEEMLARISSLDWLSTFALLPIGMAVAGPIASSVGARPVLLGGVALAFLSVPAIALTADGRRMSSRPYPADSDAAAPSRPSKAG